MRSFLKPGRPGGRYWSVSVPASGPRLAQELLAVDGEVDRLPELDILSEEGPARIQDEHPDVSVRHGEEARPFDSVLSAELLGAGLI